ncbi:MAG: TIGR01777 family protein [Gammaproteobacteria bacterium]|nr:TIGR01777 family protein [Gammaproteobacteria bacterium]
MATQVLVTGGTGFIGSELIKALLTRGYEVSCLSRSPDKVQSGVQAFSTIPKQQNFDVLINLAGHPIADSRWSNSTKEKIVVSRLSTTQHLINHMEQQSKKPTVFISGSAIGFYGTERCDNPIDETGDRDGSFSSSLCTQWENIAQQAVAIDIRTCLLRTGIVLGHKKGALKKMLLPFKLGLGGKIGDGQQWMPWIHIQDVVNAILFCIDNTDISGPVNLTAPQPVTNAEFSQTLAHVLSRPAILPMPAWLVNLLMGEMGKELLLSGKKVVPGVLLQKGFEFKYTELETALGDLC